MEEKQIHDELASIRTLMERSSKFISLSGLSGILAGVYALAGAGVAYHILYGGTRRDTFQRHQDYSFSDFMDTDIGLLIQIAALILFLSLFTGFILTYRKAKRKGQPIWGNTSKLLLFHLATPLVTGGILILILVFRGHYSITAPLSLAFYGLALIGASSYTFSMVKYLGLCEIILGLIAACLPGYGLLFWAIGFGVLHIIYGSLMYIKYDR